ncbi:hypothetical protein LDY77_14345, partial [Serratia marcescens]|uniref:hypothetical protein n=1 Tax=Serratia marcescens TaxID=615 RepID=UPI001CDC8802
NVQPVKDDCIDRSVILGSVPGSENLFLAGQILFKKMCRFLCYYGYPIHNWKTKKNNHNIMIFNEMFCMGYFAAK